MNTVPCPREQGSSSVWVSVPEQSGIRDERTLMVFWSAVCSQLSAGLLHREDYSQTRYTAHL